MVLEQELETRVKVQFILNSVDKIYSVQECAEYLECDPKTVLRNIHKGKLVAEYKCGQWRIPKIQFIEKLIKQFTAKEPIKKYGRTG